MKTNKKKVGQHYYETANVKNKNKNKKGKGQGKNRKERKKQPEPTLAKPGGSKRQKLARWE